MITPVPLVPGVFVLGVPEAVVSTYRFSPFDSRPAGLMKLVSWIDPTWVLAVVPPDVTDTVPSRPTEIDVALGGMVIGGWIRKPLDVTIWPFASVWNEPS